MAKSRGEMQFQDLKAMIGLADGVNPIAEKGEYRDNLLYSLETRNRQQFLNRYQWITIDGSPFPKGIDPNLIERILFYRFKLCAFKDGDRYWTVPFALDGNIDVYGRYTQITPLTFMGSVEEYEDEHGKHKKRMADGNWFTDIKLAPTYDINDMSKTVVRDGKKVQRCVILNDYSLGLAQTDVSRYAQSKVYNSLETDIIALIRHNLLASAKIYAFRVPDEGTKKEAMGELEDMTDNVLENGQVFFPITSAVPIEEMFEKQELETQSYWECFVSLDNLREQLMGIENNGIFKKKERELEGEEEKEGSQADLVYNDGLYQRQQFCTLFNAMFGEQIWCIESNAISKEDNNEDIEGENDESGVSNENIQ